MAGSQLKPEAAQSYAAPFGGELGRLRHLAGGKTCDRVRVTRWVVCGDFERHHDEDGAENHRDFRPWFYLGKCTEGTLDFIIKGPSRKKKFREMLKML